MRASRLNVGLFAAVVLVFGLGALLDRQPGRRSGEFIPNMLVSIPWDSFSANPVFPDGKTLQQPPPGSVPRGLPPLRYAATKEDALRAGAELLNPFAPSDAAARARGAAVYLSFCQVCHGPTGIGDGPVALRGFPAPLSLLAENARRMRDGQMFHVLTYGQNNMPSYAGQIDREDRWRVILYVRALQAKGPVAPSPAPGAPAMPVPADQRPPAPPAPAPPAPPPAAVGGRP